MDNNARQGDMADQASGNMKSIALKLKQTDAKILQAIERSGASRTHGMCRDCGEPIAGAAERIP